MRVRAIKQPTLESVLASINALKNEQQSSHARAVLEQVERDLRIVLENLSASDARLATADVDLESFSYSVAHDLRSPIRQIAGFAKILGEEYGSSLPEEGRRYLHKISQGAKQMGNLVDDLLHLSQIGRQALTLRQVALNSIVASAIESLRPECANRTIDWRVDDLCSVACDPGLMKQAFVNLLANAVKFTRPRIPAVIEIGIEATGHESVVFVRDNGVGFDMKYVDKLFGVFQRLHTTSEFEGTGIGLATVARIVRKHGGRIWAQSEPNRGATFSFTVGACV